MATRWSGCCALTVALVLVGLHAHAALDRDTVSRWMAAADSALDQAKSRGRNRVVISESPPFVPAQAVLCLAA